MMIDETLMVSRDQVLSGTANSTDTIDVGHTQDIGVGSPLWWVIVPKTALTGTGASFQARVEVDDNDQFSSSRQVTQSERLTTIAKGARIVVPMSWRSERFLRLSYALGGTAPSMTVDAFLTNQMPPQWTSFPNAID